MSFLVTVTLSEYVETVLQPQQIDMQGNGTYFGLLQISCSENLSLLP